MRDAETETVKEALKMSESAEVNGYGAVLLLKQAGAGDDVIEVAEGALEGEGNANGVRLLVLAYLAELAEAEDTSTSKERLTELLKSEHERVREAARNNPGARNLAFS